MPPRFCCLAVAAPALGAITRVSGPTDLLGEPRILVKFDAAFDTANRVYLIVWGTQNTGPVNGLFLNEAGVAVGGVFPISAGAQQSGWARVIYSPEQGKFLVSYVKILGPNQHQKLARFVTYASGTGSLSNEIPIDSWTGGAGNETGLAYSAASQRFFVTWWRQEGSFPASFVATLDASGTVLNAKLLTNLSDGQSDPEIACDPVNRRCFVAGWSWGVFNGGKTALWGRFIDDATGEPQGTDSFYIPAAGYLEEPTITYNSAGGRFQIAYSSSGQIYGNIIDGASGQVSGSYPLVVSSSATASGDGGGYGFPTLTYNSASQTMMIGARPWSGYPVAQEVDSSGSAIQGAIDFVPDAGGDGTNHPWDFKTQYVIPVANTASSQFLLLDNHYFEMFRVSRYTTGAGATPPPPAPTCTASLSETGARTPSSATSLAVNITTTTGCAWTATSNSSWLTVSSGTSGTGNGTVSVAVAQNTARSSRSGSVTIAGASFTVTQDAMTISAAVHDVNGDGLSDLIWQHQTMGYLATWYLSGPNVVGSRMLDIDRVADTNWKVVGSGDLNGDGYADLVWQHTQGYLATWYLHGTAVVGTRSERGTGYRYELEDPRSRRRRRRRQGGSNLAARRQWHLVSVADGRLHSARRECLVRRPGNR